MSPPAIADLLPHAGAMVLLDRVVDWSADAILCRASSHRDPANPLRRGGMLPAICGAEYGAQAMAVHGALLSGGQPQPGMLVSLRDLRWHVDRLDTVAPPLDVSAQLSMRDGGGFAYRFTISADGRDIVTGQAVVRLGGPLGGPPGG